jgi:hypothetical protein
MFKHIYLFHIEIVKKISSFAILIYFDVKYIYSFFCRHEIQTVRAALYVRGLLLSFGKFSTKIAIFVAIVSYAALGNKITAEKVRDSCSRRR